jgi:hypothetical protein
MAQAGESLRCPTCGTDVPLPTYRELRQLADVDADRLAGETARRSWSPAQGYQFVLGLCLMAGALAAGWVIVGRLVQLQTEPPDVSPLVHDVTARSIAPHELWDAWIEMRDDSLADRETPFFLQQRAVAAGYWRWLALLGALALVGLALSSRAVWRRSAHP